MVRQSHTWTLHVRAHALKCVRALQWPQNASFFTFAEVELFKKHMTLENKAQSLLFEFKIPAGAEFLPRSKLEEIWGILMFSFWGIFSYNETSSKKTHQNQNPDLNALQGDTWKWLVVAQKYLLTSEFWPSLAKYFAREKHKKCCGIGQKAEIDQRKCAWWFDPSWNACFGQAFINGHLIWPS